MEDKLKQLQEKNVYRNPEQINVMTACIRELYCRLKDLEAQERKKKKAKK